MPDRYLKPWMRRWAWPFTIGLLFALLITTITLSVVVYFVRDDVQAQKARNATAEVATCYASARGRPGLVAVLRVIASGTTTAADREIVNQVIDSYEARAPSVPECDELARMRELNPADFPPPATEGSE